MATTDYSYKLYKYSKLQFYEKYRPTFPFPTPHYTLPYRHFPSHTSCSHSE
jgi:hypothetical protein